MRHDPYHSPWREIFVGLGLIALVVVITAGVMMAGQRNDTPPAPTPVPTVSQASPSPEPESPKEDDAALTDVVYSFVEAYNLPASPRRNELLKKLSTPEGYAMVYRDPASQSSAEKAAGNIVVSVVRNESSVQVESFEDETEAVSVYAETTIRIVRDGTVINTTKTPGLITSWVKGSSGWRFAYIQF